MSQQSEIRQTIERVLKVKDGPLKEVTICSNVIFNSVADLCQLLAYLQDATTFEQVAQIDNANRMLRQVRAGVNKAQAALHDARKAA